MRARTPYARAVRRSHDSLSPISSMASRCSCADAVLRSLCSSTSMWSMRSWKSSSGERTGFALRVVLVLSDLAHAELGVCGLFELKHAEPGAVVPQNAELVTGFDKGQPC